MPKTKVSTDLYTYMTDQVVIISMFLLAMMPTPYSRLMLCAVVRFHQFMELTGRGPAGSSVTMQLSDYDNETAFMIISLA